MILDMNGNPMVNTPITGGFGMPKNAFAVANGGAKLTDLNGTDMNDVTYFNYLFEMMGIYMSVFEWSNLPEGVDARMLEYWLMQCGYVGFLYDEALKGSPKAPDGFAVMRLRLDGEYDMYQLPENYHAYSVDSKYTNIPCDYDNSVIIFNNMLRVSPLPNMMMYAKRLANIERTTDVNIQNQKAPKVIKCNEKQKLSYVNMMNQVAANEAYIWASDKMDLRDVEVLDTTAPYVADRQQVIKHQYWNEFLTFAGVENTNTEKKERRVTDEVLANMGDVEVHRFMRIEPRKTACDEINNLLEMKGYFDENPDVEEVDVNFRSGVYIRTDKEGFAPTAGMQDDSTGYESDDASANSFLAALKKLVGSNEQ